MKAAGTTRSSILRTTSETRKFGSISPRQVALAGAAALVMTGAIAIGVWQGTAAEDSRTATRTAPSVGLTAAAPRSPEPGVVNYLVGSKATAQALLGNPSFMEISDDSPTGLEVNVLVLDGSLDEAMVMTGFEDVNASRIAQGLDPVRVIDLRSPAPRGTTSGPAISAETTFPAFALPATMYYLVGSEDQRQAVLALAKQEASDPNSERTSVVLMAGTAEQEADAMRTLEGARARWAALGAMGLEIVDLR